MKQILVTVDTNQPLQNIRKAINMLRGVVSTTVVKEPVLTKTQKQQAASFCEGKFDKSIAGSETC